MMKLFGARRVNSFIPHTISMMKEFLIAPFWGNEAHTERLRNLPKVTELAEGRLKHMVPDFVIITTSLHCPSLEGRGLYKKGACLLSYI